MTATAENLTPPNRQDMLAQLLDMAQKAGAEQADAVMIDSTAMSVAQRMGKREKLEREEAQDIGLRVFIGQKQAIVSATDHAPNSLKILAERAVAMAKAVPEDPYCALAEANQLTKGNPELDLVAPGEPDITDLSDLAAAAEESALAVPGISNSDGAEAGWSRSQVLLADTNAFMGAYALSRRDVSVGVIAAE